jgi:ABC-type antimicrobial peptide transport system permease subunit
MRTTHTVVGVVPDFIQGSIRSNTAGGMITETQSFDVAVRNLNAMHLTVSTTDGAAQIVPAVRRIVDDILPNAVRADVASGRQLLEQDLGRERLGASFFSGFGLVSLVLGLAGVFGLVSFLAESRRREIGVRMALGATPNRLMRSVVSTGLLPVAVGAVAGLVAAGLLSHTIEAFVHGVGTLDAVSYAGAAMLMLLGASAAGVAAAARIRRVSPMEALRAE